MKTTRRRRLIWFVATGGISSFLIGVGVVIHVTSTRTAADPISIMSMFAGLAGVILAAWQLVAAMPPAPSASLTPAEQLHRAAQHLADSVELQWTQEVTARSLRNPSPLRVLWSTTTRDVAAAPHEILGDAVGGRPTRLEIRGRLDETVMLFNRLPRKQLVVIGEPGGGKTVLAMLFTLQMLAARTPDAPVPVMLPLLSWDPTRSTLEEFVTRRLTEDYGHLRDASLFGYDAARRLVLQNWIVPVLDGLDEMPEALRPEAIAEIARTWSGRALVLTCRTREFEAAVRAHRPLAGAAVVELESVPVEERIAYLREGESPTDPDRWAHVALALRTGSDPVLTDALSTPLMVSLTRLVYERSDPSELLDRSVFPTHESIEESVLDALLGGVYPTRLRSAGGYHYEQVRPWFEYIARDLSQRSTRDLAWWLLFRAVPWQASRWTFVALLAVIGAMVAGADAALAISWYSALITAPTVAVACGLTAVIPVFFGSIPDLPVSFNVRIGFARNRRESIGTFVSGGLVPGIGVGVLTWLAGDLILGILIGSIAGILGSLVVGTVRWSQRSEIAVAPNPHAVLRADRRTTALHWIGAGLPVGLVVGVILGHGRGTGVAVATGVVTGTGFGFGASSGTAYMWYVGIRIWLALRRRLPWRLMSFLNDAQRCGVLRQFGSVYQFRHGRLQDRLAGAATVPAPSSPTLSTTFVPRH